MEYLKKIKEIRNIGFLGYWAWMLLVKSGGTKGIRICFGTQVIFLIIHDNTEFGIFGKLSSEGAKNEEHRSRTQAANC